MKTDIEPVGKYQGKGDSFIKKVLRNEGKIWINTDQYFSSVPEEAWKYRVGGYQVLEKWLKSRKGKYLGTKEVDHFRKTVAVLAETLKIQAELDKAWNIENR
jgi:hypothetical protein